MSKSNPPTQNATLQDFVSPDEESQPDHPSIPETADEPENESPENTYSRPTPLVNTDELDDRHTAALIGQLEPEKIEELVDFFIDKKNILYAVKEATDDEALENNIEEINTFSTSSPSLVEAAADAVEEELQMRPFELTITEPDNEFQNPMVDLDVDEGVLLTNNPSVNGELVSHATRIHAETKNGQKRLANQWADALGEELLREFKQGRHPNALGFTLPRQIPATGDDPDKTPITEIPYIGEATAEDIHPTEELLSIQDLLTLTNNQFKWLDFPIDNKDYDNKRTRQMTKGIVELAPDGATNLVGRILDMMDQRERDGHLVWVNPANAFGIAPNLEFLPDDRAPVAKTESDDENSATIVTDENGETSKYSNEYWELLKAVESAETVDTTIHLGDEVPASLELPDGNYLIAAPQVPGN